MSPHPAYRARYPGLPNDHAGEPGDLSFSWLCGVMGDSAAKCTDTNDNPISLAPNAASQTVTLRGLPEGRTYVFYVGVGKGGRTSGQFTYVTVKAGSLPVVSVQGLPGGQSANPSSKITIFGTVTSAAQGSPRTWWTLEGPSPKLDLTSPAVLLTSVNSTSLVIAGGALAPRSTYYFRLHAEDAYGAAFADVAVATSGQPRSYGVGDPLGTVAVTPTSGIGLQTPFRLTTSGWLDEDAPLYYQVSYVVNGTTAEPVIASVFSPSTTVSGILLPAGVPEGNFAVIVRLIARNSAGVVTSRAVEFPVTVTWPPLDTPEQQDSFVSSATDSALEAALSGNANLAVSLISGTASLLNQLSFGTAGGNGNGGNNGNNGGKNNGTSAAGGNGGGNGKGPRGRLLQAYRRSRLLGGDGGAEARSVAREQLGNVVFEAVASLPPSADALQSVSAAVGTIVSAPEEVTPTAQDTLLAVLGTVVTGGPLGAAGVSNSTAQSAVQAASDIADAAQLIAWGQSPAGRLSRHRLRHRRSRALLGAASSEDAALDRAERMQERFRAAHLRRRALLDPGAAAAAQDSPPAPASVSEAAPDSSSAYVPPSPADVLGGVMDVLGGLQGSLRGQLAVPGEAPASVSVPAIQMSVRLDSVATTGGQQGGGTLAKSGGFSAPGAPASFDALPPAALALLARASAARASNVSSATSGGSNSASTGAVVSNFLALAFSPYPDPDASGDTAQSSAQPVARLAFTAPDGARVSVRGLEQPITFELPLDASSVPEGFAAQCRFWCAKHYSLAACVSLPAWRRLMRWCVEGAWLVGTRAHVLTWHVATCSRSPPAAAGTSRRRPSRLRAAPRSRPRGLPAPTPLSLGISPQRAAATPPRRR